MKLSLYVDGVRRCGYTDAHGFGPHGSKSHGEKWVNTVTEGGRGNTLEEVIDSAKYDAALFVGHVWELVSDATGDNLASGVNEDKEIQVL